jgi:hypothetical protein
MGLSNVLLSVFQTRGKIDNSVRGHFGSNKIITYL